MTNESKKITAKFAGKCSTCGGFIPAGTQVNWIKGAGVSHIACPSVDMPPSVYAKEYANNTPFWENGAGAPVASNNAVTVTMGVFKKDGKIFVVKPNKAKTRVYAKEIIESPARITENGTVVDFEAIYRPGAIYKLAESDRWDIADAQDFLTKFSKCIVCGRTLKAAKSVASAIGPVCRKYFAHNKTYTAVPHGKSFEQITTEVAEKMDNLLAKAIDNGQVDFDPEHNDGETFEAETSMMENAAAEVAFSPESAEIAKDKFDKLFTQQSVDNAINDFDVDQWLDEQAAERAANLD